MKLFHLSDLHLGKRLNEFSLLEDQAYILRRIVQLVDQEKPDGVMIAGDVYDKSVPPAEAVRLFDDFLSDLSGRGVSVFVISGNHDSPDRLSFGYRLMENSGVYVAPPFPETAEPVEMMDAFGMIRFYLLPFVKPVQVRSAYDDQNIETYTDALSAVLGEMEVDPSQRNVLITHQFVTGASRSDSEEISVGGSDHVDAAVFDDFDYVALGHLHNPQSVGRDTLRYCGTPLKYSFSEAYTAKSITVVELLEKGNVRVDTLPLEPLRDLREIRGPFGSLLGAGSYSEDYLHVTLTDEEDVPDAAGRLRALWPNLMRLDYDNRRTREQQKVEVDAGADRRSPLELFAAFYEQQNNQPMSDEQLAFVRSLIEKIWEGEA